MSTLFIELIFILVEQVCILTMILILSFKYQHTKKLETGEVKHQGGQMSIKIYDRSFAQTFINNEVVSKYLTSQKNTTLKQQFLSWRFLRCQINTDHLGIPNHLYNVLIINLVCLTCIWQSMAKINNNYNYLSSRH